MKKIVSSILLIALTLTAAGQVRPKQNISKGAKGYAQKLVKAQSSSEPLESALFGVMAVNLKGDTLVYHNAKSKMIPASTMKTITTGLAIRTLGPDYRYQTRIGYSGEIRDSVLHGDLYIVGGGDPTIGSKDSIATSITVLFNQWTGFIRKAGINRIEGRIVGDGRYFNGEIEHGSWSYDDLGTYYGAGGNGLCFYRNIVDINVAPGLAEGDSIKMSIAYPQTPWINYIQNCRTGKKDTGDRLCLYNTDLSCDVEMRGTLAAEHYAKKLECSNKFGALTCAYYFSKHLNERHIPNQGFCQIDGYGRTSKSYSCTDNQVLQIEEPGYRTLESDSLEILGTTFSPTLKQIAYMTNYRSDNFYAETLMKTMGKIKKGSSDYRTCAKYYEEAFKEMGLQSSLGRDITDGSGLSRKNYIAPEFFCRYLKSMLESEDAEDFIGTLASPGKPHYKSRLKDEPDSVRSRIFLKSGSMNGVRCFCGYIAPQSGIKEDTIIFSIMTNNCTASDWRVYPILDQIIAAIAFEN